MEHTLFIHVSRVAPESKVQSGHRVSPGSKGRRGGPSTAPTFHFICYEFHFLLMSVPFDECSF